MSNISDNSSANWKQYGVSLRNGVNRSLKLQTKLVNDTRNVSAIVNDLGRPVEMVASISGNQKDVCGMLLLI